MLDINTKDKKEQRKFGIVMAVAFAVLGLIRYAIHGFHVFPVNFMIVAVAFLALGLVIPKALQPVFWAWIKFAIGVNWVMTRVLLTVSFFGMIVPASVLIRLFGDDPLNRKWKQPGESYWEDPEEQPAEFERYLNQF